MPQRFRLAAVDEVPAGTGKEFVAGGRIIAVFHVDDGFHALDGICPHAGGPLAQGYLRKHVVTCPWHGWQFDVTTGQHCLNARLQHTTFPVVVENNEIFVDLPDAG